MLKTDQLEALFEQRALLDVEQPADDPVAPAALPDVSLAFLVSLAKASGAKSVFEFGSGRSTAALLSAGLTVLSVEDSAHWMAETRKQIGTAANHRPLVKPLSTRWWHGTPFLDWHLDAELTASLRSADIILIDSPYYPPFRESTLLSALSASSHALIVLDDTRIPTLERFCNRIAHRNPSLLHRRVRVGHCFDIFCRVDETPIDSRCGLVEVLKGWRRFLIGRNWLRRSAIEATASLALAESATPPQDLRSRVRE